MSPAPTARARPSPSCARSWKPRACACTSTPRRIWCASTSASGSARRAAARWSTTTSSPTRSRNASAPMPASRSRVFEITTAAAFLLFARHPADVLLLEVGLGGRLDATNVIEQPLASVDHAGVDATTPSISATRIEKIAAEKAGILKRGVPAVDRAAAARGARRDRARRPRASRAPLHVAGEHWTVDARSAAGWSIRTRTACSICRAPRLFGPAPVRQCRRRDRGAARAPGLTLAAGGLRGGHRARPNGRRACSGSPHGKLVGARCRPAASSGSTAATTPTAAARSPPRSADLEERVSRPLVLIVGMLATKDARRLPAAISPGWRGASIAVPIPDQEKSVPAGRHRRRRARAPASRRKRATSIDEALAAVARLELRSAAAHPDHRLALSRRRGARRERHAAGVKRSKRKRPADEAPAIRRAYRFAAAVRPRR